MEKKITKVIFGGLFVTLSALCYAWMPVLAKIAYSTGLEPHSVLILRYLFTFAILFFFMKLRGERGLNITLPVVAQGIFFTAGGLFFFYSLKSISAGLSIIIFFSHPVIISLIAVCLLGESFNKGHIAGLVLATGGIILISVFGGGGIKLDRTGIAFSLASSLCYSFYSLLSEKNMKIRGSASIAASMTFIGLLIVIPLFFNRLGFMATVTGMQAGIVVIMAFVSTMLSVIFFLEGVKRLGAARASLAGTVEPVFVAFIAYFMLGEVMTPAEGAGSVLVFSGMLLSLATRA